MDSKKWIGLLIAVFIVLGYLLVDSGKKKEDGHTAKTHKKVGLKVIPAEAEKDSKLALIPVEELPDKSLEIPKSGSQTVDYVAKNKFERAIKTSRYLLAKALPTSAEVQTLNSILFDKDQIDFVFDLLRARTEKDFTASQEIKRMDSIALIVESLIHEENPQKNYLLEAFRDHIENFQIPEGLPVRLKRSLAADKVELIKALMENNPTLAQEIEQSGHLSASAHNLFKFTKDFYFN